MAADSAVMVIDALSFSISIQSETACLAVALPFTLPARLMAPPYNRNFSVRVVFPASGCDMIAKVLQIEDIVIRKTGVSADSIIISTVNAN